MSKFATYLDSQLASASNEPLSLSKLQSIFVKEHAASENESEVAQYFQVFLKYPQYNSTTWAQLLSENINPNIRWKLVIDSLDTQPGHDNRIKFASAEMLALFLQIISKITKSSSPPPPSSSSTSLNDSHRDDIVIGKDLIRYFYLKIWMNLELQNEIINNTLSITPELFDFTQFDLPQVIPADLLTEFGTKFSQARPLITHLVNHPHNLLNLIVLIFDSLSRSDNNGGDDYPERKLIDKLVETTPELLFLGGVQLPIEANYSLPEALVRNLFDIFFRGHPSRTVVFHALWKINPRFLLATWSDYFNADRTKFEPLELMFEISMEADILSDILISSSFPLVFELAVLAARVNPASFSFDSYLRKNYENYGNEFIMGLFSRLEFKINPEMNQNLSKYINLLDLTSVFLTLQFLNEVELTVDVLERFKHFQNQCLQCYPRLINFGQGHDQAILANGNTNTFPIEVENEMKGYYQQMYEDKIDIRDVINMLQNFKKSDNPHEQDVFACMVHSLFDEYRFFPEYPLTALAATAVLFGSLVYFHLIQDIPLSVALRLVLESLQQAPETNMFKFGLQALFEFRDRLHEFPKYCSILYEIPGLRSQPILFERVESIIRGTYIPQHVQGPPPMIEPQQQQHPRAQNMSQALVNNNGPGGVPASGFTGINIDMAYLEDPSQEEPPELISDRVLFIVNNLAQNNVNSRSKELAGILDDRYFKWFAQYIVSQRAKLEPNYHSLYISMIKNIASRKLEGYFLAITYYHIANLLNSNKTISSSTDRTQLKNLGHWLGYLTLARDKPIRHKNISFKTLLIEGYEQQKLPVVIPFVCKVFDMAGQSKVFLPPNPWLMGIIYVLAELYQFADLKLNLKFEVEVLCNSLKLNIDKLPPSTLIRSYQSRDSYEVENMILAQELRKMNMGAPGLVGGIVNPINVGGNALLNANIPGAVDYAALDMSQQAVQQQQQKRQQVVQQQQAQIANVDAAFYLTYIALALQLDLRSNSTIIMHPGLKRFYFGAIEKTITELLAPIVERSVSISIISTRSLVLKDFALDGDEQKLIAAARELAGGLAGSIAYATCKDPVRETLLSNLKVILLTQGYSEENLPIDQITLAINDTLESVCAIIERASSDRATIDIEEQLAEAILMRRNHREIALIDQPFSDPFNTSAYAMSLPDPLRLAPTGVTAQQFSVYENFGKRNGMIGIPGSSSAIIPNAILANTAVAVTPLQGYASPAVAAAVPTVLSPSVGGMVYDANVDPTQTLNKIQVALESLVKLTNESTFKEFKDLPENDTIRLIMSQILVSAKKNIIREQIVLKASQWTVSMLFTVAESKVAKQAFSLLLGKLCEMSASTQKDVLVWLVQSTDERKFNVPVMSTLLRSGFVSCSDLDINLSKQIQENVILAIKFTCDLIQDVILGPNPCALRTDFTSCIEILDALHRIDPSDETVGAVIKALNTPKKTAAKRDSNSSEENSLSKIERAALSEEMAQVFIEWIRLTRHPAQNEKILNVFLYQMFEKKILIKPEYLTALLRASIQISIESYEKELAIEVNEIDPEINNEVSVDDVYSGIDGLAKLICSVFKSLDKSDLEKCTVYVQQIFSIISIIYSNYHEKSVDQKYSKPFFRFFSTMLCEMSSYNNAQENAAFAESFYIVLCKTFRTLQPMAFPGFTFSWMSLISHRMFMHKILELPNKVGWEHFIGLLNDLLKFQTIYGADENCHQTISVMYTGTLRIFLALLHDYPAFLIEHHYTLCNIISPSYIQLRNLILSAFPSDSELPDPLTQGLKVDRLPEVKIAPNLAANPSEDLERFGIKKLIDVYLKKPSTQLIKSLATGFNLPSPQKVSGLGFSEINVDPVAFNALVLYVGNKAVSQESRKSDESAHFDKDSNHLALLTNLIVELDTEGRYFLFEAFANQLRYPNSHTHFFSCVILSLFGSHGTNAFGDKKQDIQHIIVRVLLERIICNRPHPWGLMITFTELLKNSSYKLWDLPFIKSVPEIEGMFSSLYSHISNSQNSNNNDNTSSSASSANGTVENNNGEGNEPSDQ